MELSPLFVRLCVWAVLVCLIQHVWAFHEKREVNPTLSDMSPRDVAWSKSFVPYRPNALGSTVKAGTRFLHILNPYAATDKDLIATFHITMASLDIARQWLSAKWLQNDVTVDIVAIVDEKDRGKFEIPTTFQVVYLKNNASWPGSHPPLHQLLSTAQQLHSSNTRSPYTHVIYSNVDIGVLPHFYQLLWSSVPCSGAFFVGRVEIPTPKALATVQKHQGPVLDEVYRNTLRYQQRHAGYDCMVFATSHLPALMEFVGPVLVGYPPAGKALMQAAKFADLACLVFFGLRVTFHLGTRNAAWAESEAATGYLLNKKNYLQHLDDLQSSHLNSRESRKRNLKKMRCSSRGFATKNPNFGGPRGGHCSL